MLSEPRYDVEVVKNILIPMTDGTRIAADLFMPRAKEGIAPGKFPAVFEAYPYRKDDMSVVLTRVQRYLARHGYVGILLDVRGTGASEGTALDEYCEQEQLDLVAVTAWVAEQP
jgi:predicted acyl esterase